MSGLASARLSIEIQLAVEVGHCDTVGVPTAAPVSRAHGPLVLLVVWVSLAKTALVDGQIGLLVHLTHLTLRSYHLVICENICS